MLLHCADQLSLLGRGTCLPILSLPPPTAQGKTKTQCQARDSGLVGRAMALIKYILSSVLRSMLR